MGTGWGLVSLLSTVILVKVQLLHIFNHLFMAMGEKCKNWMLYPPLRSLLSKLREIKSSYMPCHNKIFEKRVNKTGMTGN